MTSKAQQSQILVVSPKADEMIDWLKSELEDYFISFTKATTGIEALETVDKLKPILVLIDCKLPEMNGMSLSSIIKDTICGDKIKIFLYNMDHVMQNAKADFFCLASYDTQKQLLKEHICAQVRAFVANHVMQNKYGDEIMRAKINQFEVLPHNIDTPQLRVTSIFSPYSDLSGDGFDYWLVDGNNGINGYKSFIGFLFDCTGHDLVSYTQSGEFRILLKKACRLQQIGYFSSLGELLNDVNCDLFDVDKSPDTTAAMVFCLDFAMKEFVYATAGINHIFVKKIGEEFQQIDSPSPPLGYESCTNYIEEKIHLSDYERIILATDGFSELITKSDEELPKLDVVKHDDVTAIILYLRNKKINWNEFINN